MKKKYDFILKRRSIRKYKNKDIPEDDMKTILKSAMHAPIPYEGRTWKLLVVEDKNLIDRIAEISGKQEWVRESNKLILGIITPARGEKKWKTVDVTITLENIVMMAEALGYGSCWVGYFKEKRLKELLKIPPDHQVLAYITIGVKNEIPPDRDYGRAEDYIFMNKFGEKYAGY